ncbi:conserved hypothetical protein [Arthrobacter sp. Hiyo8]|nr:conserved hypothetical protein [Arthrobacter sp. Hiyo8]
MRTAESSVTIDVDGTPVSGIYGRPDNPVATLVLAHGAGRAWSIRSWAASRTL